MADPAIIYLDVDDEITAAAARIRDAEPSHIAIVIPPGSHIATSRINFRLLAREAQARNRRLSIVAPDAASRAIAASAGLDVHASVAAFEAALAAVGGQPEPAGTIAPAGSAAVAAATVDAAAVDGAAVDAASETPPSKGRSRRRAAGVAAVVAPDSPTSAVPAGPPTPPGPARPVEQPAIEPSPSGPTPSPTLVRPSAPATRAATIVAPVGRRRSRTLLVGTLVVIGLLVVGSVAAAIYLPTATITVTPRPESVGPVELTVSADPAATGVDAAGGIVPGTTVSFPVTVSRSFPATGKRVEETRATGTVTFTSGNTDHAVSIIAGTRVATLGGIVFATTRAVTVPEAKPPSAGSPFKFGVASVPIRALKGGPEGNVTAGEISQGTDFLSAQEVSTNNAKATSGGKRTEFSQVTQKDVDAAVAALKVEATRTFAGQVAAEEGVPEGQTLFPATATLGPLSYDPRPDSLVGDEVKNFELAATATGTATAVDVSQIEAIAQERLVASVAAGAELVPGSVKVSIGDPVVTGTVVTFPATATADQVRPLDADAIKADILGLPIDQAEAALDRYGNATITVWPDLVTSIPTIDSRVTVTIVGVTPSAAPSSLPP